ncbi:unnamed protein product [Moneuplotes crassus]|uniref:Uncharacterized protein n=1 Tax=Euplotes crassus TaxID=5936 RepID=A0AAD1ULG6_EUPCR|nr:unnamed protein product [Moneuplotes crassus]
MENIYAPFYSEAALKYYQSRPTHSNVGSNNSRFSSKLNFYGSSAIDSFSKGSFSLNDRIESSSDISNGTTKSKLLLKFKEFQKNKGKLNFLFRNTMKNKKYMKSRNNLSSSNSIEPSTVKSELCSQNRIPTNLDNSYNAIPNKRKKPSGHLNHSQDLYLSEKFYRTPCEQSSLKFQVLKKDQISKILRKAKNLQKSTATKSVEIIRRMRKRSQNSKSIIPDSKYVMLGGIGPSVYSNEYHDKLKRKKIMMKFSEKIKKIHNKRYNDERTTGSNRHFAKPFLANNGKISVSLKPIMHKKNKSEVTLGEEKRKKIVGFSRQLETKS